jgi:hypothetical protein
LLFSTILILRSALFARVSKDEWNLSTLLWPHGSRRRKSASSP